MQYFAFVHASRALAPRPYVKLPACAHRVVYHVFTAFFLTHQRIIGTTSVYTPTPAPSLPRDIVRRETEGDHRFNIRKNM